MDYGNQQPSQHSPQFGSNLRGQHAVRNEGRGQYGHSNPKQDVGPGPSRYGDDKRESSRDSGHDGLDRPVVDRKRRRSPDRGFYKDHRPGNDNNSVRKEDAFGDDFTSENLRDQRGFPKFQPDRTESFRGGEISNSGKRCPEIERSPYGNHASGLPSMPDDNRHADSDEKRNSSDRWHETPQQPYKADQNTQNSNNTVNESPSQTFKTEGNSQNSNSLQNETPPQSNKTDPNVPPPKISKADDMVKKDVPRYAGDPSSTYKAVTWRNQAAAIIAKEIFQSRSHQKSNHLSQKKGLVILKDIIKLQLEELIRLAFPDDILAVVPVEEMLVMYKSKFNKEDLDELFAKIFVMK